MALHVDEGEKRLTETSLPKGSYEVDPDFCEVPYHLLAHQLWRYVGRGAWRYSEHIGILESRALVKSLKTHCPYSFRSER